MDIASLTNTVHQISSPNDVSVLVLKKQLDQQKNTGDQMTKMMEQSVNPNVGSQFDVSV